MTLVSDIINRAYRETNVISIGASPTATETSEALSLLNSLILSTVGNEVADGLNDIIVGGTYDQSTYLSPSLPDNKRMVLNLSSATTVKLDPYPFEGQRAALVDVSGNLSTNNLTIDPNGRKIEDALTLTLNTDGIDRQWLYRADTGNWVRITSLTTSDEMPLPIEFDDYFSIMLAIRLNPRHGAEINQETVSALKRMRSQINGRYRNPIQIRSDLDPRGFLSSYYWYLYSNDLSNFDSGRVWYL